MQEKMSYLAADRKIENTYNKKKKEMLDMRPAIVAKELNVLNRYCKQLNILEDYLLQYKNETFSPRILMSGNIRNEKIDQIGLTLGVDVKAHIRELFAVEWKKEYGTDRTLYDNAPHVLMIKGDVNELIKMIRQKKKLYYAWKEKVLFIAAKKGNLKPVPMHPPAHKIHGIWMECLTYGNRRFHIFSTPEKVAEYNLKYPNASDWGANGYLNYQIYAKEEIEHAETVILDFLEKNKKYLKNYVPVERESPWKSTTERAKTDH